MGVTVELESADLWCRSAEDAARAAALVAADDWVHPYHLQVSPVQCPSVERNDDWCLAIDHFQGDHWHDDRARALWLRLAPFMADGATIEFQGEGYERWRIRWEGGRVFEEYVTNVVWAVSHEIAPELEEEEAS